MGRELQKRKRRSSRAKVTMPNVRKKALDPVGSGIIAKNWDKKETLSQNYSRFGLVAKLGTTAGGTAKTRREGSTIKTTASDPLSVRSGDRGLLQINEVKVERDADGRILRVIRDVNPLNDALNEFDDDDETNGGGNAFADDGEEWAGIDMINDRDRPMVIRELEREANQPVETRVRHQSDREREWLQSLVTRHGDDVAAMARDRKLNPMQQTAADLSKRLKKAGMTGA